ncbi:MAG: hypothetical protein VR72_19315 [Clostridiaceae bacterium BRH_c20a]|nr:MAG: hypothetical protein VR72_19315 [Clostridiaceae bacterium BRH_c20a]
MKTLIISNYNVISEYIKDALSELQLHPSDKYSWYKGKFYTKELYLVENYDENSINDLLDIMIADGPIKNIISIGLASSLVEHLRQGDILINDYPSGSCQVLVDRFLNQAVADDELPLRIFAGNIYNEPVNDENIVGLACLDLSSSQLFLTAKNKGLSSLAIRIINSEKHNEELDTEVTSNIVQSLLFLLKKVV